MLMQRTAETSPVYSDRRNYNKTDPFVAVYEYNARVPEKSNPAELTSEGQQGKRTYDSSKGRASPSSFGMNGYSANQAPPAALYVRALYDYDADDHTSLSFKKGDVIQVLTQLESGWWDGVINDVRGWFPSNYCAIVSGPDDPGDDGLRANDGETSAESGTEDEYDDGQDDDLDSEGNPRDDNTALPLEGTDGHEQEEAAFWIPQATPDGRLFYFNIMTGVSTMELPLETTTSRNETGPQERTNFSVPDQTRPPPELMARGFERDDDQYDETASEVEGDPLMAASTASLGRARRSMVSDGVSDGVPDNLNVSPMAKARNAKEFYGNTTGSMSAVQRTMPPLGVSATSFANSPSMNVRPPIPKYFLDDGSSLPTTWSRLMDNMRYAIEAYKSVVNNGERAEFVRKAEDISDHLRMLLAAGSGTTDNHSGAPSIISTNKALYPHFREMMSRFSKLVLSSHIAAADWAGPDSYVKCLQEADGVLNSIFGYVDVARHQRGEEIPRLVPGFVHGNSAGANWQNNNIDSRDPTTATTFMDNDDYERPFDPTAPLDSQLVAEIDDARKPINGAIKRLNEQLYFPDKIITSANQVVISDSICESATRILDLYRPWISLVESADLGPLGSTFQTPLLVDFSGHKQRVYDSVAELVTSCQAIGSPLGDEWAETYGESLEDRLGAVQAAAKQLDNAISEVSFSLQLLMSAMPNGLPQTNKSDHRLTDGGETYTKTHLRVDSLATRPQLADIGQSKSYTLGVDDPPEKFRRIPNNDKARRFFGQMPPPSAMIGVPGEVLKEEQTPWFLALDYENEVFYDNKTDPPQLKSGSLTGLVEQLTRHDRLDSSFNTTFLLTYRSFTTATELFQMLVKRFSIQPPPGLLAQELSTWELKKQTPIRLRVVNVLKAWFENYWMEGTDDASMALLQSVYQFAKGTIASTKTPGAPPLMSIVEQRMKGQDTSAKKLVLTLTNSAPTPIVPKNMKKLKFLDVDATEFARQLTIIEAKLYGKIKPTECLNKTWSKKINPGEPELAPNVKALILHSNQLTNWVAEMILSQNDVKRRVIVIKHFVAIADKCRILNNYSGLTAIISAFGTAPILRLKRTWDQLNQKTAAVLESMRQLMSNTKNFNEYREKLHFANPPCIPFFGVYLTDLTFIEDGIPSVVKNTNLINFTKRAKTAEVIRDIQQYQNVPYSLQPVSELQDYILEHMKAAGDVHEMYDRSLQVEPREREDEKITRLLSESGFL